jgi:DNA-binding CsgD family transcriptional regulator
MLQTIRDFGLQLQLAGDQDEVAVFRRHYVAYFVGLAERGDAAITTGEHQVDWLTRLELEHANLVAAIEWAAELHAVEDELRLTGALAYFWIVRGYFDDAIRRVKAALARGQSTSALARAKPLTFLTYLMLMQRDLAALPLLEEAQRLADESGHVAAQVLIAVMRGQLARAAGDTQQALQYVDDAIAIAERSGRPPACILRWQQASMLMWAGDLERSRQLQHRILRDAEACGDLYTAVAVLADLGTIAFLQNEIEPAIGFFRQALRLAQELGELFMAEHCLETQAAAAQVQEQPRHVPLVLGAADRLCARLGIPAADEVAPSLGLRRPLPAGLTIASAIAGAQAALGERAFAAARRAGYALTVNDVLADAFYASAIDAHSGLNLDGVSLTPRERQVVTLLARGRTNRQIAADLVIAPSTAERHVANILDKLSLGSRTEVAVWAVEHRIAD